MNENMKRKYLLSEQARLATFTAWPFSKNKSCSISKMAEAGFVFTGTSKDPDSAQCCFCSKHLDNWEENDVPWLEHLKHSPQCLFAQMQKPQEKWTVRELLDITKEFCLNEVRQAYAQEEIEINEIFEKMRKVLGFRK